MKLILSVLLLASSASALAEPRPLTERNKADIIRQVKDDLLDGESARWRWPAEQDGGLYCAWVNAKNRMGAYNGWTPFMVIGGVGDGPKSTGEFKAYERTFATPDADDTDTFIVNKMCSEKGYDMSGPPPE